MNVLLKDRGKDTRNEESKEYELCRNEKRKEIKGEKLKERNGNINKEETKRRNKETELIKQYKNENKKITQIYVTKRK